MKHHDYRMAVSFGFSPVLGPMAALFLSIATLVGALWGQELSGSGDLDVEFARHLYQQGEYRLAAEEFKQIAERNPNAPRAEEALFFAADCWVQLEVWDAAKRELRAFLKRYPVSPWAQPATLRLAAVLFEVGELADAEELYLEVASYGGEDAGEAFYWAGEAAFGRGKVSRAVAHLDRALELLDDGETQTWALRRKAQAFEDQGNIKDAVAAYRSLASTTFALPEDLLALSRLLLSTNDPAAAERTLSDLRSRWPGWMQSHRTAELDARARWEQGKREEAVELLADRPDETPRLLAWMLLELGRARDAVTVLTPALGSLEGSQRSEAVVLLARALRATDRLDSADSLLAVETGAITSPDLLARAILQRGELLAALKRFDEASSWLERGLPFMRDARDSCEAFILMGEVAAGEESWEAAQVAFLDGSRLCTGHERRELQYRGLVAAYRGSLWTDVEMLAEELQNEPEDSLAALAAYWAGEAASRESRFTEAITWYTEALDTLLIEEDRTRALYGMGWASLSQKDFEQAAAAFSRAAESSPAFELAVRARLRQGDVFMLRGMYRDAARQYRAAARAVAEGDIGEEASLKLGRALALAGDVEVALGILEELYQSSPSGEYADDALFEKGEVLFRAGRFSDAEQAYDRVVELRRDRALRDNALYRKADSRYNREDYAGARELYLSLVRTYPESDLWAQAVQGALWATFQLGDAETALTLCDSLSARADGEERRATLWLAKADLLYGLERYDEALNLYSRLKGRPDAALRAAWCLAKMEQVNRARVAFESVAERWPESPAAPEATYQAAKLAKAAGSLKQAASLLEQLLSKYPESDLTDVGRYDLGLLFLEAGALSSAEETWTYLMERGREPWRSQATLRLVEMQMEAGRPDSAMALVEPLLRDGSGEHGPEAHWLAAEAELSRGRVQEARKLFLRLSFLFPETTMADEAAARARELASRPERETTP